MLKSTPLKRIIQPKINPIHWLKKHVIAEYYSIKLQKTMPDIEIYSDCHFSQASNNYLIIIMVLLCCQSLLLYVLEQGILGASVLSANSNKTGMSLQMSMEKCEWLLMVGLMRRESKGGIKSVVNRREIKRQRDRASEGKWQMHTDGWSLRMLPVYSSSNSLSHSIRAAHLS